MAKEIKILAIHGLGDHRASAWRDEWEQAVRAALPEGDGLSLTFEFAFYDPIFEETEISFGETLRAFWKLAGSGILGLGRRRRGWTDISDRLRWTAGYVVAWVEDEGFQAKTRKYLLDLVKQSAPDIILAHSLGSLIAYNAFSHADATKRKVADILRNANFVTFGSQIANPFVVGNLTHGRVQSLPVRHWHHLFNEHDDIFTAAIRMQGVSNFTQLLTPFDLDGVGDHSAAAYLGHNVTTGSFWRLFALDRIDSRAFAGEATPWARPRPAAKGETRREKRALLVGIDEYPNEADRLAGCVNDVFTMSAVLQECGFEAEEIRTCLNDRATAKGILDRLEWLLDDVEPGDQRVFYYSGHGARLPEYGKQMEPDRLTETLVPWDFDWSPATGIADEQIYDLYAQLPYEAQVMLIFDCCHSGSMHRQSGAKPRGITPPDDIRHRQLKWDVGAQMWVDRDFQRLNPDFSTKTKDNAKFFGEDGTTIRLGRAALLRQESESEYRKARKAEAGPVGPYLPLIIEACGENEFSYEYRHGATSYGAFTFCLASILREKETITFEELVAITGERLRELQYDQTPQILGPSVHVGAQVPWRTGSAARRSPRLGEPGSSTPRLSG